MRSKQVYIAAILGLAVLSASPARGGLKTWFGTASEFWSSGNNWAQASEPTVDDQANFIAGGFLTIRSAVKLSANRTIQGFFNDGDHFSVGAWSFSRINGAVLTVTGTTTIGDFNTSPSTTTFDGFLLNTGILNVGGQMTAVITGNANITTTGALTMENSSVLNFNGGSLNLAANNTHNLWKTSRINVNGGTLNLGTNSTLNVNESATLNFSSGYNVTNNTLLRAQGGGDIAGASFIDVGNGGVGFLTINQAGSTFSSQSSTSDWGRGAGSNAVVDIFTGGTAQVEFLRVGTVDAQASLNVAGGTLTVNNDLEVGGGTASRSVQLSIQNSGTMTLNDAATFNNQADLNLISGTLNINQNATFNAGSRFDRAGGTLNIASGKKLIINDAVYNDTRTSGQILSDGAGIEVRSTFGRFNVSNYFDIGNGSLLVEAFAQYNSPATATTTDWAQQAGTVMTATVRAGGRINMGALRIAQSGGATVNVENNGRIETTSLTIGGAGASNAVVNLNGGFVTVFGSANLGSGTQMTLNDPVGDNTTLGQFTRFLVDGTLNLNGNAVIFTQGENPIIQVDALNMTGTSRLRLERGAELFITYGSTAAPLNSIRGLILSGFSNGAWSGVAGISSSAAQFDTRLGVGYVNFPDATFGSMTVKLTLKGDTNLTGTVDFDDLLTLAQNYNLTNKFWQDGDSNYDGSVNFDDLLALAQNYNLSGLAMPTELGSNVSTAFAADWARAQSMVPEPASVAILAVLGAATRRSRR